MIIRTLAAVALAALLATQALAADCSGTITTGGTAQSAIVFPDSQGFQQLNGVLLCNVDAAAGSGEPLWVGLYVTAAAGGAGSLPLSAPTATSFAASNNCLLMSDGWTSRVPVSVVAATSGHKYFCARW